MHGYQNPPTVEQEEGQGPGAAVAYLEAALGSPEVMPASQTPPQNTYWMQGCIIHWVLQGPRPKNLALSPAPTLILEPRPEPGPAAHGRRPQSDHPSHRELSHGNVELL